MHPQILLSPEAHASTECPLPCHCSLLREKVIESSERRDIPARDEVSLNEGLWEGWRTHPIYLCCLNTS